ncbi:MAG: glutamine synthetase, partial [Pseudomonadota bacterium]
MNELPHQILEHPAEPGWKVDFDAFLAEHSDLDTLEVVLPDTNGVLRGKWLPGKALKKVFEQGVAFPYSLFGLDVWGREVEATGMHLETGDKDGVCWPIPETLKLVPWTERKTAQVLLSMYDRDGDPFLADPRHVLENMVDRLKSEFGVTATC